MQPTLVEREALLAELVANPNVVPEEYQEARPPDVPQIAGVNFSDGSYGACLSGNPGIGKTYAATALAWRYMLSNVNPVWQPGIAKWKLPDDSLVWVSAPYLLARIRDTFRKKTGKTEAEIIDECIAARLLLLDDLGAEKQTEFTGSTLYTILSGRRNRRRYTIITTNQMLDQIESWEPRIASRMAEMTQIVLPPNRDWRLIKKYRCA